MANGKIMISLVFALEQKMCVAVRFAALTIVSLMAFWMTLDRRRCSKSKLEPFTITTLRKEARAPMSAGLSIMFACGCSIKGANGHGIEAM